MLSHELSHELMREFNFLFITPVSKSRSNTYTHKMQKPLKMRDTWCIVLLRREAERTSQSVSDGWLWPHHDRLDRCDRLTESNAERCRFATEPQSWKIQSYFSLFPRQQKCSEFQEAQFTGLFSPANWKPFIFAAFNVFLEIPWNDLLNNSKSALAKCHR